MPPSISGCVKTEVSSQVSRSSEVWISSCWSTASTATITQRPLSPCQNTFGSRKFLEPRSRTGLSRWWVQVVPPSVEKAMDWAWMPASVGWASVYALV